MRWNILAGVALALALFGSTPPAAHAQQITQRFLFTDGITQFSFVEIPGTGTWLNQTNNMTFKYVQIKRNNDEVILIDYSRNWGVMLKADGTCFWAYGAAYPWYQLAGQGTWLP